ncbi:GNAT family N-acetyltransferase [Calditrichota bacterium]
MTLKEYKVRLAQSTELKVLNDIEIAAGAQFRNFGFDFVADMEPMPQIVLKERLSANHLWVIARPGAPPVGFCCISIFDGLVHLEEVSVHPDFGRQGLGTLLVESLCKWAKENGYPAVTLSTFLDIPWNAPFYSRLGFQVTAADKLGPWHLKIQAYETRLGLDKEKRVFMQKIL